MSKLKQIVSPTTTEWTAEGPLKKARRHDPRREFPTWVKVVESHELVVARDDGHDAPVFTWHISFLDYYGENPDPLVESAWGFCRARELEAAQREAEAITRRLLGMRPEAVA